MMRGVVVLPAFQNAAQLRAPADAAAGFAGTGMGRSFSATPELAAWEGEAYSVRRKDGGYELWTRDGGGHRVETAIDAVIGSGRHARMLLSRAAGGGWLELPLAWYAADGGKYAASPHFGFSEACLACHARGQGDHPATFGCVGCHAASGGDQPGEGLCLQCHLGASGLNSGHGTAAASGTGAEDKFELNSSGYRLLQSRCYRSSGGKLTCTTCHPAHTFSKTAAEYRMVCRGCHPTMHNGAPLECPRCHMPKRGAQDAAGMLVADHRIQRPL